MLRMRKRDSCLNRDSCLKPSAAFSKSVRATETMSKRPNEDPGLLTQQYQKSGEQIRLLILWREGLEGGGLEGGTRGGRFGGRD